MAAAKLGWEEEEVGCGGGGGGGGGAPPNIWGPVVLLECVLGGAGGFGGVGGGIVDRNVGWVLTGSTRFAIGKSSHTVLSPLLADNDPILLQRRGGIPDPQDDPTPLLLLLCAGDAGGDIRWGWKLLGEDKVVVFLRGGGGGGGDLMRTRVVCRPLEIDEVGLGGG